MIHFSELKNKKFIMAGPNVIESEEQILNMAQKLKIFLINMMFILFLKQVLIKQIEQAHLLIEVWVLKKDFVF